MVGSDPYLGLCVDPHKSTCENRATCGCGRNGRLAAETGCAQQCQRLQVTSKSCHVVNHNSICGAVALNFPGKSHPWLWVEMAVDPICHPTMHSQTPGA